MIHRLPSRWVYCQIWIQIHFIIEGMKPSVTTRKKKNSHSSSHQQSELGATSVPAPVEGPADQRNRSWSLIGSHQWQSRSSPEVFTVDPSAQSNTIRGSQRAAVIMHSSSRLQDYDDSHTWKHMLSVCVLICLFYIQRSLFCTVTKNCFTSFCWQ